MTPEFELISQKAQDLGRGVALLTAGGVMVLLKWVVPAVAPLALGAYGLYQLFHRNFSEGAVALGLAVVLWYLQAPLGGVLWLVGTGMAAAGLFFLIRGVRTPTMIH